jgi:hypothetical protein
MPITISVVDDSGKTVAERMYNLQGPMQRFDKHEESGHHEESGDKAPDHDKDDASKPEKEHSK